jgi:hypothetical protein
VIFLGESKLSAEEDGEVKTCSSRSTVDTDVVLWHKGFAVSADPTADEPLPLLVGEGDYAR